MEKVHYIDLPKSLVKYDEIIGNLVNKNENTLFRESMIVQAYLNEEITENLFFIILLKLVSSCYFNYNTFNGIIEEISNNISHMGAFFEVSLNMSVSCLIYDEKRFIPKSCYFYIIRNFVKNGFISLDLAISSFMEVIIGDHLNSGYQLEYYLWFLEEISNQKPDIFKTISRSTNLIREELMTHISEALETRNFTIIKEYYEYAVPIDSIEFAIQQDDESLVQKFMSDPAFSIKQEANITIFSRLSGMDKKTSLLYYAALKGSLNCFKTFLICAKKNDFDPQFLHLCAIGGGNMDILHISNEKCVKCEDSLYYACVFNQNLIFDWIFSNYKSAIDYGKLFYLSCIHSNIHVLKMCIDKYEEINAKSKKALFSYMHALILYENIDLAKFLIENPLVEIKTNRKSEPLINVAAKCSVSTFKFVASKPGFIKDTTNIDGETPLHICVVSNNIRCLKFILENHTVDFNAKTKGGSTPLHYAVRMPNPTALDLLNSTQLVDNSITDNNGKPPFFYQKVPE